MSLQDPHGPSPLAQKLGDTRAELIPCPILRTLLHEGWLHCDGEGHVRLADLEDAMRRLGLDPVSSRVLTEAAAASSATGAATFSVYGLRESALMHNADSQAQRTGYDPQRLERMLARSSAGGWLTLSDLAGFQRQRLEEDPGLHGHLQGGSELAALVHVFGRRGPTGELALRREDLIRLYRENRFPRGWKPPEQRRWTLPLTMARYFASLWMGRRRTS